MKPCLYGTDPLPDRDCIPVTKRRPPIVVERKTIAQVPTAHSSYQATTPTATAVHRITDLYLEVLGLLTSLVLAP
jgi:hypothetical protein